MNERNQNDDQATGLASPADTTATVYDALGAFDLLFAERGYHADMHTHHWGDFTIDVYLDDHRIATVYNDLDEFEKVARRVDEGEFEPLAMEATA